MGGFLVHEDGGCHSGACCGSCRAWPTGSSSTCGGLTPESAPEVRTASAVLLCLHCAEQREGAGGTVRKDDKGKHVPKHTNALGPKLATVLQVTCASSGQYTP